MLENEIKCKKITIPLLQAQMSFDCIWNSKFYSLSLVTSLSGGRRCTMHNLFTMVMQRGTWNKWEHTLKKCLAGQPANQPVYCFHCLLSSFLDDRCTLRTHCDSRGGRLPYFTNKRINNMLTDIIPCDVCVCCACTIQACGSWNSTKSAHDSKNQHIAKIFLLISFVLQCHHAFCFTLCPH